MGMLGCALVHGDVGSLTGLRVRAREFAAADLTAVLHPAGLGIS